MEKNFISTIEASKILGISRIAIFKKIKSGEIKAEKVGRNFIIHRGDLPYILSQSLGENQKKDIHTSVKRAVHEYGETIRLLGKE